MFDLDNEIQTWSQTLKQKGCISKNVSENNIDELVDHLYCEIEALQNEGLSAKEAFEKAVEQFGESGLFLMEQDKNRSSSSAFLHASGLVQLHKLEKRILPMSNQSNQSDQSNESNNKKMPRTILIILVSLCFATAMIATPHLVSDKDLSSLISDLLYAAAAIFIITLGIKNRHSLKCEYLWIKRNLLKLGFRS